MARARDWFEWHDEGEGPSRRERGMPEDFRRLKELRRRVRASLSEALDAGEEKRAEAVAILEKAAEALEKLFRR